MVRNGNDQELSAKHNSLPSDGDFLSKIQKFLDNNIRVVKNVSWIIGGIGIVVIIKRTYALHHFTHQSRIPVTYFTNHTTLTGKVLNVNPNGILGVQHIPLLWRARLKWISEPSSTLLSVKITGVELRNGGLDYLASSINNKNVKFKLLGKDDSGNIESILYKKKGWFQQICINKEVIESGFAVANHVEALSHVKAYNMLIETLVKAETKAVKKKTGIWQEDLQPGVFKRTWWWLKRKIFKT